MPRVRVLILRAAGTNCDRETEHAWRTAGADAECVHIRRVAERPELLDEYRILTIPGGFSYGDDIAAGRIFAARIERHLRDRLHAFVDAGKLVQVGPPQELLNSPASEEVARMMDTPRQQAERVEALLRREPSDG